ncbi:hypothetical protein niasHT_022309 [Heterodera trifolii]|uniref:RING-type domain-containing protein n=1 Tax=Heterodera trifolii TaxID=157864 RepID=A0ABD2KNY6_9BILA
MHANTLRSDNINEIISVLTLLKQSLAFAVFFVANRHKIQWNDARGEGKTEKSEKEQLEELIKIERELLMNVEKAAKNNQNREDYGENEKEKARRERFLRFVTLSLEMKWDESAFSNGQSDENGKGQKDKRNAPPPANAETNSAESLILSLNFFIATLVLCIIVLVFYCAIRNLERNVESPMVLGRPNEAPAATNIETIQRNGRKYLNAYNAIPVVTFLNKNNREKSECAICITEIGHGAKVRPLPCKHFFHEKCIKKWFLSGYCTCPLCRKELAISPTTQIMTLGNYLEMARQNGIGPSNGPIGDGTARGTADEVIIEVRSDSEAENDGSAGGTETDSAETDNEQGKGRQMDATTARIMGQIDGPTNE